MYLDFPFSHLGFQHGFYIIWYLSGRSGGAGSEAFAEQLSFWTAQGLIYVSILSLVMPLLSLVTVFVFQVDDSNADKNVSSAQIVGPGPKPEASAKPPARPVDTYDNFVLPELPSVPDTLPTASAGANTSASEDIDFDDLSRRFEELKKKT